MYLTLQTTSTLIWLAQFVNAETRNDLPAPSLSKKAGRVRGEKDQLFLTSLKSRLWLTSS